MLTLNRKPCQHGVVLERGLCCDHGYIQVRLPQIGVFKNFGRHTSDTEEIAKIYLAELRKRILMGKAGIKVEDPQRRFAVVARESVAFWRAERDGDGRLKHSDEAVYERIRVIEKELIPVFGPSYFDEVTTQSIEEWREALVVERGISGTTVNRYQAVLSGLYSDMIKSVKAGKVKTPFRLPAENPCLHATWAATKKRKRIYSAYELKKLKLAFRTLNDDAGWAICELALKSVLSLKDLQKLESGHLIDTERSKTGVPITLPIAVLAKLDFSNWRKRWEAARAEAGLQDAQFRDLRKTGINEITGGNFDQKLVSQYAGHASVKTTEGVYQLRINEKLKPLADHLEEWVRKL
jgi:integrase